MFADVVGFTGLGQQDESAALEAIDKSQKILKPVVSKHRGRIVKTLGDGFLLEFGSALEATLCAVDIQNSVQSLRLERGENLSLRIGIHLGDVILRGKDILGDAVNVASRIEPLAEPGGICITGQVYDQIRNKVSYGLTRIPAKKLKGVRMPVEAYRLEVPSARPMPQPRERVAVMPFLNISPDPHDEYFADGLTEEMIARLSLLKGLEVIARTSVMNYKGKDKGAVQVGRELGAGTLLEGSVRKAGDRIRVTVQLIDSNTEAHLWTDNYERELDDIFVVQSAIAEKVAQALEVKMLGEEKETLERQGTTNPGAYVEYLRGLQYFHKLDNPWVRKAIVRFEKALEIDPAYAAAAAQLSLCYLRLGYMTFEPGNLVYPKAEALASRSLQLDETVSEAHLAMAMVQFYLEGDWSRLEAEFRRAFELNPSSIDTHLEYGRYLSNMGRFSEAIRETERILELDPVSFVSELRVGGILFVVDRPAEGAEHLKRAIEMEPDSAVAHGIFGNSLVNIGRFEEGLKESEKAFELSDKSPFFMEILGRAAALAGRKEIARRMIGKLLAVDSIYASYSLAIVYAALGEKKASLDSLEKAYEEHAIITTPLFTVDPVFAWLTGEPRFKALARKLRLRLKQERR